ncbi:MAG: hypothetical protein JO352_35940 [Chloroflexi bacterium]|nr:hypothetical protein [Chloroflexota bacterium]MBV9598821.1 hypothetical protein [Chloroflexota bacterium]
MQPAELERLDRLLADLRNEVAHLADANERGRHVSVEHLREPPYWTLTSTVVVKHDGKQHREEHTWTRDDILGLLDQLDPWLERHFLRWIGEWRAEAAQDAAELNGGNL